MALQEGLDPIDAGAEGVDVPGGEAHPHTLDSRLALAWSPMESTTVAARTTAWLVHAYTASGSVLALLMIHFAYTGEVRTVLWLFLAAMVVDGTDGFLARHFQVKTHAPNFDGALLDNIVDYLTYVFVPAVLLWSNGYLPGGLWGGVVASVPLVTSCYQFCRSDAKTDDHFFLGFPSYWNVVAFYVVVMGLGSTATTVLILVFAVLVFVPIKYVYPSRTARLWTLNMTLATIWLGFFAVITAQLPDPSTTLVIASFGYVAYYTAVSFWLTFESLTRHPRLSRPAPPPRRAAGRRRRRRCTARCPARTAPASPSPTRREASIA